MPTEYERNLEAKRRDEEKRMQEWVSRFTNIAPMGRMNPYIEAQQAMLGKPYVGALPAPNLMSWLDRGVPGAGEGGLKGGREQEASFIARYGMSPADIMESYRVSKIPKGGEVTSGQPSTLFTGASGLGLGRGLPTEQGLDFNVGRRYREGQPILYTKPEEIKPTARQQGLLETYKAMRERFEQTKPSGITPSQRDLSNAIKVYNTTLGKLKTEAATMDVSSTTINNFNLAGKKVADLGGPAFTPYPIPSEKKITPKAGFKWPWQEETPTEENPLGLDL